MVYEGKPSKGCQNCKKSHAKCDEKRPACSLCLKRNLLCPGYQSDFDLVLRDQTSAVQNRARQTYRRKQSKLSTSAKLIDHERTFALVQQSTLAESNIIPISKSLHDTPEQRALCSFFTSYILMDRHPETSRGFLEILLPIYQESSRSSPLSSTTSAVALLMLGARPDHRFMQQMGRAALGNALGVINKAIQDPIQSKSDEVLMGVLLLGFAEGLLAVSDKIKPSGAHAKGAVALIKHRGKANFRNEMSRRLFIAVRTQMVSSSLPQLSNCFKQAISWKPGQVPHAISAGLALEEHPPEWAECMEGTPLTAATRLTFIGEEVTALKAFANSIFSLTTEVGFNQQLLELLILARKVDENLTNWEYSVPEGWRPQSASDTTSAALLKFQAYGTSMYIYHDLWVASTWNSYRLLRLVPQAIMLKCTARAPSCRPSNMPHGPPSYIQTMQKLVNDVCASVPFAAGDKVSPGQKIVDYPWIPNALIPATHRRVASAVGPWFLLGPLTTCLELETSAGLDVEVIEVKQRRWIINQMGRFRRLYGLKDSIPGTVSDFEKTPPGSLRLPKL